MRGAWWFKDPGVPALLTAPQCILGPAVFCTKLALIVQSLFQMPFSLKRSCHPRIVPSADVQRDKSLLLWDVLLVDWAVRWLCFQGLSVPSQFASRSESGPEGESFCFLVVHLSSFLSFSETLPTVIFIILRSPLYLICFTRTQSNTHTHTNTHKGN